MNWCLQSYAIVVSSSELSLRQAVTLAAWSVDEGGVCVDVPTYMSQLFLMLT